MNDQDYDDEYEMSDEERMQQGEWEMHLHREALEEDFVETGEIPHVDVPKDKQLASWRKSLAIWEKRLVGVQSGELHSWTVDEVQERIDRLTDNIKKFEQGE